ncbi:hypothetical protein FSP39_024151 [Pinctada imbricata]|uniref:Sterile alpha motif domain-containing protein 9-like n=1 Tax=Pinctada imbricata TaxID=66713 RepID=A0AA88YNE5_PINIB|nr:hypothetical protein FSP39_024151 [Pinctada imbricata]
MSSSFSGESFKRVRKRKSKVNRRKTFTCSKDFDVRPKSYSYPHSSKENKLNDDANESKPFSESVESRRCKSCEDFSTHIKRKRHRKACLTNDFLSVSKESLKALPNKLIDIWTAAKDKDLGFYLENPDSFILDVISRWNTPTTEEKSIFMKLSEIDSIGVNNKNVSTLLNILSENILNYRPPVKYDIYRHGKTLLAHVSLPSSRCWKKPVITKDKTFKFRSNEYRLGKDELWYRDKGDNVKCTFNDSVVSNIYRWFDQSVHEIDDKGEHTSIRLATEANSSNNEFLSAVNSFSKGHFVLLCGDIADDVKYKNVISFIPWLYVFDFDVYSRDKGLLNVNEHSLDAKRSLHLCTWKDATFGISEESTVWMFPRGRRDDASSRLQNENDVRLWNRTVRERMKGHIDQLQRFVKCYTVLTMVIIWPQTESLIQYMHKFIELVDEAIEPRVVLLLPQDPKSEIGKSSLRVIKETQKENLEVFNLNLSDLFQELRSRLYQKSEVTGTSFSLPDQQECKVTMREAAWLREDMDILYLENQYGKTDVKTLAKERDQFYRGGSIHWFAWYECGNDLWDVERDIKHQLLNNIQQAISKNKCEVITLYHAPGSGGTTLAQRVVWELHESIACAHVKLHSASSVTEFSRRVEHFSEKTHKPIVLLIDGEEESKVNHLARSLRSRCVVIILYVKRFPYEFKEKGSRTKVWLKGIVSKTEAKNLALKFGDRCSKDPKVIKQLNNLSKDVQENHHHFMYEFGMTAFTHDFKGVHSYVKGYLQLDDNETKTFKGLKNWQKILGYLSLVYFYGQASIPCQFFAKLLGFKATDVVDIDDFRHPISDFIVKDKNESRKGYIRICHHIIAQEILEQILGGTTNEHERGPELSKAAKSNLAEFCKDFIEYASDWTDKTASGCSTIVHVLTRTFIFRDNRDMCENAEQIRKKPVLSRIIIDIPSRHPLYTDRLQVLERLTTAFPDDPNFQAHLGRFYAYCRPGDEHKAEECLERALCLAIKQTEDKDLNELEERLKLTLMHIYHMYGTVMQKKIAIYTGQGYNDVPDKETKKSDFKSRLEILIPLAQASCDHFQKCRECTPVGRENCFGYIGEITVRLQICDFIQRNFEVSNTAHGIPGFLKSPDDTGLPGKHFVKSSISVVDNLFMECYNVIEEEEIDQSIVNAVLWFNHLFKKNSVNLKQVPKTEDICSYRLQIAVRKMKYSPKKRDYTLLENINNKKDIEDIVSLYEDIFRNIPFDGPRESKRILDRDYQEWLFAIRHKCFQEVYPTEEVLHKVRTWNSQLRTPMAKFYLFILTSLLGFGSREESGKTDMLLEAQQMYKDDLRKAGKFLLKPKYPREWLGKDTNGIKRLLPGTRFLGLNMEDRDTKGMNQADLVICKGTIVHPNNKKGAGFIWLDLGDVNVPVKVFYIPNVANLASTHYSDKRVEFVLAFTVENGYEAYSVKLLKKYGCTGCDGTVEITSTEDFGTCSKCRSRVQKDDMTMIT